jgi:carbon starvation protein
MWITCAPLAWLVLVTFSAGWQKIFSPLPRVGFLAQASQLAASSSAASGQTVALIFNARLDATVCGAFMILVAVVLVESLRLWYGILRGTQEAVVIESPFVLSRLEVKEI